MSVLRTYPGRFDIPGCARTAETAVAEIVSKTTAIAINIAVFCISFIFDYHSLNFFAVSYLPRGVTMINIVTTNYELKVNAYAYP